MHLSENLWAIDNKTEGRIYVFFFGMWLVSRTPMANSLWKGMNVKVLPLHPTCISADGSTAQWSHRKNSPWLPLHLLLGGTAEIETSVQQQRQGAAVLKLQLPGSTSLFSAVRRGAVKSLQKQSKAYFVRNLDRANKDRKSIGLTIKTAAPLSCKKRE